MSEKLTSATEDIPKRLLIKFQELFGLIEVQGNRDLQEILSEVKILMFEQLLASNRIEANTTYEAWQQQFFPNAVSLDNSRLIELASEHDLITAKNKSELLKANLRQLHRSYRSLQGTFTNTHLSREVAELLAKDELSIDEYRALANNMILAIYGPQQ